MELFAAFILFFTVISLTAADRRFVGPSDTKISVLTCCTALGNQLPGQVVFPQNKSAYSEANNNRWSVTSILVPSCIVQPTNVDQVSTAVKVLTKGVDGNPYACKFAIKSGGHTSWAGANNIDCGISLDLSYINKTTLSRDRTFACLGTGSTWLNAYQELDHTGIAFPGGRCGDAGVGGLTLGGGISFFTPRVGFVADNVLNYEVVLASGEIVHANRTSHSDLFTALKGGSSNFGIVTRFDIAAFDQGRIWGGGIINPATAGAADQVLSALSNFTTNNHDDPLATFGTIFSYTNDSSIIINSLVHTGGTAHPKIFQQAESITPQLINSLRYTSVANLAAEGNSFLARGYRDLMGPITFKNDFSVMQLVQQVTLGAYNNIKNIPDLDWIYSYEPLPKLYTQQGSKHSGNVLGLNRTDSGDLILMMLSPRWKSAEYDAQMNKAAVAWVTAIQELVFLLGASDPFLFLNYADGFQDPMGSYGQANVDFMKRVATKYDPQGVFQKLVPGGFKVSQARASW
ncbi:hypothetical protein LTR08_008619 [Meristemomyces frigidus]|nr:hypothetical protein LTR08_008619 [Meristemomyces frigidus]